MDKLPKDLNDDDLILELAEKIKEKRKNVDEMVQLSRVISTTQNKVNKINDRKKLLDDEIELRGLKRKKKS